MSGNLKEKTAQNLFWGGLSNTIQQLLGMLIGIVLARKLSPGDYGLVAMLTIFSLLAGCLQESGFTSALAVRKRVTKDDYNSVFWFSVSVSLALYVLLFTVSPFIARYNHTPELTSLARVSFLGFVISSLGTAQFALLFREMRVKQRMIATLTGTFVSGLVGISMAYRGFSYWSLVGQDLTYKLVTTSLFWYFSSWRPTFSVDFSPIRRMFGFSSKMLITNMLTYINNYYLQTLLGAFGYRKNIIGLYTQANKWNALGYSMIGGMVNSIAQPVLSRVNDDKARQVRIFRKMLRFTAFLSFPVLWGIATIAPEFIPLVLGEQWRPCVPFLQLLCVSGAVIPLSQLYANLVISKGKSSVYLWGTFTLLMVQLSFLFIFSAWGMITLLIGMVTTQVIWLFVWHILARRYLPIRLVHTLKDTVPFACATLVSIGVACFVTYWLSHDGITVMLLKIILSAGLYALFMQLSHAVVFKESMHFLLSKFLRLKK